MSLPFIITLQELYRTLIDNRLSFVLESNRKQSEKGEGDFMKLLKEDFNNILKEQRIKPVFQPIVCLSDGHIIGYEALSRITEPQKIKNSEELFHLAGLYGKIWELEQLCRSRILEAYHDLAPQYTDRKLFLNVNPMVIHDKEFHAGFTIQYLKKYNLNPNHIVFEVTERNAIDDVHGFKDTIRHYKSQEYQIAIDDAGSCYSGLNLICDIVPHYLKLDIALIHNIDKDTTKYAMVKSLVEFSNLTNIQLVAEGIETEEELKTLLKLGVHHGQGYFLRKPNESFKEVEKDALEIIQKHNRKKNADQLVSGCRSGEFRVVLFKLENSKAYRAYCEKYGDEKGDELLQMMKLTVAENLSESETMATLDSDTIVSVLEKSNCEIVSETILNVFRNRVLDFYESDDLNRGYIKGQNKRGETKKYPLITISSERIV